MKKIVLFIFFGLCCFFLFGQNTQKENFEIYIYFNSSGANYKIPIGGVETKGIIFFTLQKKMPVEGFDYSLQEIVLNKITKVKRQNWEKKRTAIISFIHNPKVDKVKIVSEEKTGKLNMIYTDNVRKIKFSSIKKILKKADVIYIIVKEWNNDDSLLIKAYEVKIVAPLGGM